MLKPIPNCQNFNGYKPCLEDHDCWSDGCKANKPIGTKILIINLDAMGDVLMTTAQLPGLKRKFPESTIYWITLKPAHLLLQNNHYINYIFTYDFESISILNEINFHYVMNVDKSQRSCALLNSVKAEYKLGFGLNENGKIIPVNDGASYNYLLGMNNQVKFKENTKTGQEYLAETFEIDYQKDDYTFNFTKEEIEFQDTYKQENGIKDTDFVVGFNTGCSLLFPNKKMTVEQHIFLIDKLLSLNLFKIILVGGPEDTERNDKIASRFGNKVINTPTNHGLRKGACFENLANVIVTGDSFGMHMAIALKKYVIAWFGLSCWTEIEMYDRGVKLFQNDLHCSPCWKKSCPYNLECIQMIDLNGIIDEIMIFYKRHHKS
jgi:ADP-heptose:LPS heptosyltransferase